MSVLGIFGQNLRHLSEQRGTLVQASDDLGLTKIQFQRYLRGESFPKPHILQKICSYFDVDARILTEQLTPTLLRQMRDNAAAPDVKNSAMMEAINFACPEQTYFDRGHDELPDGVYRVLRPAMAFTDRFAQLLFYVKTLNKARVVRGFDPNELYARAAPAIVREYRGVVHQHADGYSLVFYHKPPGQFISHIFVSPLASMHGATGFLGFGALGRAEMPGRRRLGRLIMLPLQKGFREAMAQRRQPFYIDEADIEPPIRLLLNLPLG